MKRTRLLAAVSVVIVATLLMAGCAQTTPAAKGPIRVGSKIDVEGPVLANIIIAMLDKNGFTVQDKTRTGATDVVRKALVSGEIDVYPEYTANAILLFHKDAKVDPAVLKDCLLYT